MRGMLFLPRVVLTTGKRHSSVTGLQKPASSHSHAGCSHLLWAPAILCMLAGKTQREKNRYYVKSVGGGVKFLCVNEFRLCGTTETLKVNLVVWIYLRKGRQASWYCYTKKMPRTLPGYFNIIETLEKHGSWRGQEKVCKWLTLHEKWWDYRDWCNTENVCIMIGFVTSCQRSIWWFLGFNGIIFQLYAEYMSTEI